jgi:hypothetical protein
VLWAVTRDRCFYRAKPKAFSVSLENQDDAFGRVTNGWIRVSGRLLWDIAIHWPKNDPDGFGWPLLGGLKGISSVEVHFDAVEDILADRIPVSILVLGLTRQLSNKSTWTYDHYHGLVLRLRDEQSRTYQRIGFADHLPKSLVRGALKGTVVII